MVTKLLSDVNIEHLELMVSNMSEPKDYIWIGTYLEFLIKNFEKKSSRADIELYEKLLNLQKKHNSIKLNK